MFVVNAEKNKLTVCGREAITGGSVNTYVVRFVFDSAWDGMDRISNRARIDIYRIGQKWRMLNSVGMRPEQSRRRRFILWRLRDDRE